MTDWADRHRAALLFLMAALITVAVRAVGIGDIVAHGDEQFYLLIGDRMLNWGATPYVDIWDRKPVGLFLLYSGIRLLGGDGIVQYQIVALLAVVVTSGIMAIWIARRSEEHTSELPSLLRISYAVFCLKKKKTHTKT